jgi:hypothetical protein
VSDHCRSFRAAVLGLDLRSWSDRLYPDRIDQTPAGFALVIDVASALARTDEDVIDQAVDIDTTG